MRLICPNCGAQYEVADDAIPAAGRDVQCSNCGHGWFQHPHDAEVTADSDAVDITPAAAADEAADETEGQEPHVSASDVGNIAEAEGPDDAAPLVADGPADEPAPADDPALADDLASADEPARADDPASADEPALSPAADTAAEAAPRDGLADDPGDDDDMPPEPEPALMTAGPQRSIDDNLLAVLREEAERETAQRRAEATRGIETQGDLGIDALASVAAPAVVRPADQPKPVSARDSYAHLSSDMDYDADIPEASVRPAARRDLLPDVEEISSTLRSSNGRHGDDDNPMPDLPPIRKSGGFRSGFLLSILLAVVITVTYVLAPRLGEQFPAAKDALDSYVTGVDAVRARLGAVMAGLTGMIEGEN